MPSSFYATRLVLELNRLSLAIFCPSRQSNQVFQLRKPKAYNNFIYKNKLVSKILLGLVLC